MDRIVVDLSGDEPEITTEKLTADELAELDARTAAAETEAATIATAEENDAALRDRADKAIATLEQAVTGWAGLTAAQKDATAKLNVRVVIAIARLVLRKLDSAGV